MTTAVANILLEKEILLESGTNELEALVFRVGGHTFGINVAKVREVLPTPALTFLPKAHPSIKGVFQLRSRVIPCVSLIDHLELDRADDSESTLILTEINRQQTAFLVDTVERIHRINWKSVLGVPGLLSTQNASITSVTLLGDRMVAMLDFERVLAQVTNYNVDAVQVPNEHQIPRAEIRVFVADDSPTVREAVTKTLTNNGYTNQTVFDHGAAAWEEIARRTGQNGSWNEAVDVLVSDVEMPHMDGFHLCKRIKDEPRLRGLPVLLYSSIVTPDNEKKGRSVGVDAQLAKPDLHKLVACVDELVRRSHEETAATPSIPKSASTSPAVANAAPSDSPVLVAPGVMDVGLWNTFRTELPRQRAALRAASHEVVDASKRTTAQAAILRTLHGIKSAAMTIPAESVTRWTHALESYVQSLPEPTEPNTLSPLHEYGEWLDRLAEAPDPRPVLAQAASAVTALQKRLAEITQFQGANS